MKILLIAEVSETGGTRESFKHLLKVHEHLGYITHALIPETSDEELKRFITEAGATFTCLKKRNIYFSKPYFSLFYEWLYILPHINAIRPDVVVCSTGSISENFLPLLLKVPYVLILRTIPKERGWRSSLFYRIPKYSLHKQNLITTVSEAAAEKISGVWNLQREDVKVVYNSFDEKNVAKKKKGEGQQLVLTLGHVRGYKNPQVWLNVAKEVTKYKPRVTFLWLGNGEELEYFQQETKTNKNINFLGYIQDPVNYYAKADIYFQPSKIENHSRAVIDAMANGIPCVTSNVGGMTDSVYEGVNGFLCEMNDTSCYIEKIEFLLGNDEQKRKMGKEAKRIAELEFHPALLSERIKKLYSQVIAV